MSTAMVSSSFFGDFGDHYRSNGSTGLQNSSKNGFGSQPDSPLKKSSLSSVYTAVQQNNSNCNNTNNLNVMSRRLVTTTASVPINLSHSAVHRMQSSPTVPVMQQKSPHPQHSIGVHNINTQPQMTLARGLTQAGQCSQSNGMSANNKEHKKLDRSYSEPAEKSNQQLMRLNSASATVAGPMSSRYKTELCRSFGEVGTCKYGDKCQFAHGGHELRVITRHPKFKTENCKSFHSTGFCPYGPRCHFIHNSEESKTNVLNNLSSNGSTSPTEPNMPANRMQSNRFGEQLMNGLNMNGNNNYVTTYHSNGGTHPLRPKALSIGSYSLGSSGEISPPSSQSGSPTSLNSFFTEDPFNPFMSANGHQVGSTANNAFSFSPDFASLMPNNHHNAKSSAFGGSQPTLCPTFPLSANSDISEQSVHMPTMFSNHFQTSANKTFEHHLSDGTQGMATTPPPQVSKQTPVSYPLSPDSPVDSIGSEMEGLKLDNKLSPPMPTCSSPLDVSKSLPRLSVFTRFANNGNNNNDSE